MKKQKSIVKKWKEFLNENTQYRNDPKYDMNDELVSVGDRVEIEYVSGSYGQTNTVQGVITQMDNIGLTLDDELYISNPFTYDYKLHKYVGKGEHKDYEHGHETYVKKINDNEIDPKLSINKLQYTYDIRLINYLNNPIIKTIKGDRKRARAEFDDYLDRNFPEAFKLIPFDDKTKLHYKLEKPKLEVTITPEGKNSTIENYGIE
jgi:hypothetical protein